MKDGDGGLSLISAGIRGVTTADDKQKQLQKEIKEVHNRLLQLSRDWVVDPDANIDREKRLTAARKVVDWLTSNEELVYYRTAALQESLCVSDGEEWQLSDCIETQSRRRGDLLLPRQLRNFMHEWATVGVPKRWEDYCNTHKDGEPWLDPNDLNAFTRYLRDYLVTDDVFEGMLDQLGPVVNLKTRNKAGARRRARRKYVRIVLNDHVMNPGPSMTSIEKPDSEGRQQEQEDDFDRFGLMGQFVKRWATRLPMALALGAGEHVKLPPGNTELINVLEPFEK